MSGDIDPNITDIVMPESQGASAQSQVLNSFDVSTGKLAEIPLLTPGEEWNEIQDIKAPMIWYESPAGLIAERRPEISFNVYEEGWMDSVNVRVDSTEVASYKSQVTSEEEKYTAQIDWDMEDGLHTVDVLAVDMSGNQGTKSWNISVNR